MRKLAGLAGAVVLAAAVGACSSSGSRASSSTGATATAPPKSGTETIIGTVTGAAVAIFLNSNGSTLPSFPSLVFTGPVDTTISGPVNLGGSTAKTSTQTFVTPAGNLTIQLTVKTNGGQPTVIDKSGRTCYFTVSGIGSYTMVGSESTGKFAGATGSGTYVLAIFVGANLLPGKTTCSASNTGNVIAQGATIMFKASGPLTLKL